MAVELNSNTPAVNGSRLADHPVAARTYRGFRKAYHLSKAIPEAIGFFSKLSNSRNTIYFGAAPGDDLLCTALMHEYSVRGSGPTTMLTQHPTIFERNPNLDRVINTQGRWPTEEVLKVLRMARRPILTPNYTDRDWLDDRDSIPTEHIIAAMCRKASLHGEVNLRPYMFLSPEEMDSGRVDTRQVLIQTSGASARWPMANKEWFQDRFQTVVNAIKKDFHVIQIGMESDPPVQGARDLRGKTTIRQAAALLANSVVFVGLVGFLMHLARAVECRSVIVYGGREKPWQSGYAGNINLTGDTLCSPCWRWNTCEFDRECMKMVSAESVIEGVFAQAEKRGSPLESDTANI